MDIRGRIAARLSMTRAEVTVISALLFFLILGIVINSGRSWQKARLFESTEEHAERFLDAEVDSLLKEAVLLEAALAASGAQAPHIQREINTERKPLPVSHKIMFSNATADELKSIPGISTVLAGRLIAFRQGKEGKIEQLSDLLEVKGIGSKKLEVLGEYLILE